MKVLVLSTVFPNPAQPTHGLFVFERIRHLSGLAELRVVAPVSWLVKRRTSVPALETNGPLTVLHPTFWYVPGIGKVFDGLLLFCSTLTSVIRLRREFRFELIDAHFTYPEGFAAILLGYWFRCPVTITLRGTLIPLSVFRCRRLLMAWTLRRATRLIAVAQLLAQRAIDLGADPTRLEVIPNGVNIDQFAPIAQADARARLGLPLEGRLLVSVGHLSARKGFHRVLRALPDLIAELPDLSFAIVGGAGAERDNAAELGRIVQELQLGDRVFFAGAQPPSVVSLWLNAADVFVLASDYEGCPNAVWEALACGRPVVATKVGEVERMVPRVAGVLYDEPDDRQGLVASLRTALTTRWDAAAIRAYASGHTWDRVANRVLVQWRRAAVLKDGPNRWPVRDNAAAAPPRSPVAEKPPHDTTTR